MDHTEPPVRELCTSTVQDIVPSVPVFGSFRLNMLSSTGVTLAAKA